MSGRTTAILGLAGATALGIWIKVQRRRRARGGRLERNSPVDRRDPQFRYRVDIDDDTAAEIIKRARPALEQARALY